LVVVGGAYRGRWHATLAAGATAMNHPHPVAVFGMGPRRDEVESWQSARSQLDRALAKRAWLHPVAVTVFGGVDPKPNRGQPPRDIRDWQAIDAWGDQLASLSTT
jgi:menaquinone-dependent protoporphyrinogen IX oxidase